MNPGEIRIACLDDGARRNQGVEPVAVVEVIGQPDPDVRIKHDQPAVPLTLHQLDDCRGHRFEHEPKRADMEGAHVARELRGQHLHRQVRRGRALDQELVLGETLAVDVRDSDGRRLGSDRRQLETRPIRHE